eukprot:c17118_g1_i1.p1 GENE.c17118_g1_i1~~c17118_g1_i1.p1  ORF type:complete len:353 (+),score=144.82 c17118_g1_i1:60-1118(+)
MAKGLTSFLFVWEIVGIMAQFGFFDLNSDTDTALVGTTGKVFPNCFSSPNGFCGDGGRTVHTTDAVHSDLLGWYSFDDAFGVDLSGRANHALAPPPSFGPGHNGRGQSAHLSGTDSFVIPHSPSYDGLRKMTVSFWIYLLTDATDSWRVLFRKGDTEKDLTPTLLLFPDSRKVHARIATTDSKKNGIDSVTAIPLRRWTHVALSLNSNVIAIYINGVKDNEVNLSGEVILNKGSWYIGKDLFLPGTGMFLDNLKFYSSALDEAALQVEASAALPGLGPNFLRLGCKNCEMKKAIEACASNGGYHLCRRMELNGGGLMIARAMGYLEMAPDNWTAEDSASDVNLTKVGLCCLD